LILLKYGNFEWDNQKPLNMPKTSEQAWWSWSRRFVTEKTS